MTMVGEVKPKKFYYILHPKITVLVVSKCPNGRFNVAPIAWNMPVSEEPPAVALAIDRSAYTAECLESHPEASLNVLPLSEATLVYNLGSVSGRDVDKVSRFGLRLKNAKKISVPILENAIAWLETLRRQSVDFGEVRIYIMEVVEYYARSDAANEWGWIAGKAQPLMHLIGRSFTTFSRIERAK